MEKIEVFRADELEECLLTAEKYWEEEIAVW